MRLLGIACLLLVCAQPFAHAQAASDRLCESIATQDLLQCASSRLSKADAALNAAYKEKMSSAREWKNALLDVQRAWIGFRDKYCNEIHDESMGGNEADIEKTFCLASLTEDRTIELDRIGANLDETTLPKVLRALERAGYNRQEVLERLASGPEGSKWRQYASKNCEFLQEAAKPQRVECLARMNLDRSY